MNLEEIKKEAEELGVSINTEGGVIDLDGMDGLVGTFTDDNAEQDAQDWLKMYRASMQVDASKESQ